MTSFIFWIFMLTLSAGLAYAYYQTRKPDQSQKALGDGPRASSQRREREQAAVDDRAG